MILACICACVSFCIIIFCIVFSYLAAFYLYPGASLSDLSSGFWFAFSSIVIVTLFSVISATVSAKKDSDFTDHLNSDTASSAS
ncbi:hypothetical protein D3C78_1622230 [compost metagenome]